MRFWRTRWLEWERPALLCLFVGAAVLLAQKDWLWRWDGVVYDTSLALWSSDAPDDIVIVAIDDASLSALGRWPWSRHVHAQLVDRLSGAGARVIALDVIFAEPDTADPASDAALAEALGSNGRVVLPVSVEQLRLGGQLFEQLPIAPLAERAAGLGHVHVELDRDGIGRSVFLREGLGTPHWPALALAMLQLTDATRWQDPPGTRAPVEASPGASAWVRDNHVLVPFVGPPGSIPSISYAQVLRGEYVRDLFRGKFVLVGATATGIGDYLPTPLSGLNRPMPGVEFNANVLHALHSGRMLTTMNPVWRTGLCALLAALPLLLYPRLRPRYGFLSAVALVSSTLGLSFLLLLGAGVWFAPAPALLVLLLSYPVWSWLRLESAMRYLHQELARIAAERARQPSAERPDFAPAMQFLREVLPLRGWSLQDDRGAEYERWGEAPVRRAPALLERQWLFDGQTLWASIHQRGREWRIGANWGGDQPPTEAERRFVAELTISYEAGLGKPPVDSVEVVHAQISQLQQANAALNELRRTVDDGLAQMADGVLVVNALGQVLLANRRAARYLNDDTAQLVGTTLLEVVREITFSGEPGLPGALRDSLIERRPTTLHARHAGGRDLMIQFVPLRASAQRLGALIINISDISELKRHERERAELLSFLSHDLRSPLVSVLALLESIAQNEPPENMRASLRRVESYTHTTLALAEQFLELVRAESPEHVAFDELDLVAVATNAMEQVWAQASAKQVQLQRAHELDIAWTRGDASLLERAIVNLVSNAIKYSPQQSSVSVGVKRSGDWLCCSVADAGYGIPAADIPRLFDRFERLEQPADRRESGAGLGLAFVKVVADLHRGRIDVQSEPQAGSTFQLCIPADPKPGPDGF